VVEALELFAAEVMPEFAGAAGRGERLGADAARRALERRAPRRTVPGGYAFRPDDDGADPEAAAAGSAPAPAATAPGDGARAVAATRRAPNAALAALRRSLETHGERAFQSFVARTNDRRLARTAGSTTGLRLLFAGMERQFLPERAAGFTGDIQYNLRAPDGTTRAYTVTIADDHATARPGAADAPKLTITLSTADFVRIAGRDLDPVKAVLTGRLELAGDFAVALKLGEMFGQQPAF
jgi:putative sterol carrier protein